MDGIDFVLVPMFALIIFYSWRNLYRLNDKARMSVLLAMIALGILGRLVPLFKIGFPFILTLLGYYSVIIQKRYREWPFILLAVLYTAVIGRGIS